MVVVVTERWWRRGSGEKGGQQQRAHSSEHGEREESSSREHRSSWADGLAPVLGANDACGSSGRSGVVPSSSACHWRVELWKKGGLPRRRSTRIITCADPRKHSRLGGCGVRIIRSPHVRPVLESSSLAWSPRWALTITDRQTDMLTSPRIELSFCRPGTQGAAGQA